MDSTYLDKILAAHRAASASDDRSISDLRAQAESAPPVRSLSSALEQSGLSVIAEIKRRSPSRGDLAPLVDPAELAGTYQIGGASALSVLTDVEFFGGSFADLEAARAGCELPVLRKDFTVDERDIYDARIHGADAILLIVAALADDELRRFHELTEELGMTALVETHTAEEVERALAVDVKVIGVNQRDLVTFEVDPERAEALVKLIPDGVVRVAESGVLSDQDAHRLDVAGYDAVLVGEALVTAEDPAGMIRAMRKVDA